MNSYAAARTARYSTSIQWLVRQQARKGGRRPCEDYLLRGIARCGRCGGSLYTRRYAAGRHYLCGAVREARGTCAALPIPAVPVEAEAIAHLEHFGVQLGAWLREKVARRAAEHEALLAVVDAERDRLVAHSSSARERSTSAC